MTAEELEAEREEQIANGLPPRYSGKHANLTKEEQEAFEKEGRKTCYPYSCSSRQNIQI